MRCRETIFLDSSDIKTIIVLKVVCNEKYV